MRYTTRWVLAASVLGLAVSLAAGFGGDGEMTENPFYKHWAGFKAGTTVVHTEKTTFGDDATDVLPGGVEEKIVKYKLLSVSPEGVVVEVVVIEKEFLNSTESAPTKITYPSKVNKAHLDAVLLAAGAKRGEETLKVNVGKEEMAIKCTTIAGTRKKKGEDVAQKFWLSTTVPGGIVKRTRSTMQDGKLVAETTILLKAYKAAEQLIVTGPIRVMVAPNFHVPGEIGERLLVADAAEWRLPNPRERETLVVAAAAGVEVDGVALMFTLPGHLRASFWTMMEKPDATEDFSAFVSELVRFLTFKQLPPPETAAVELVLHRAVDALEPSGLWAIINMADDPVVVRLPDFSVRLDAGEGCRLPEGVAAEITPPVGELPHVLIRITRSPGAEASGAPATSNQWAAPDTGGAG